MKMFTPTAEKRKRIKRVCTGAELWPGLQRRRGVGTMASLNRDLKVLFPIWLRGRNEVIQNWKKHRNEPVFKWGCSYCLLHPGFSSGIVLIDFRERKEEGGKDRNIGCLLHVPHWELSLQPTHLPWPGIESKTSWCLEDQETGSTNWAIPARLNSH